MPEASDNAWRQERIRLTLPNDIAHAGIARDVVRAAARRYAYSASDLDHWDNAAGDVLLMHWLNGWAMDYDAITMARDEGRQLVQDVWARDPEYH